MQCSVLTCCRVQQTVESFIASRLEAMAGVEAAVWCREERCLTLSNQLQDSLECPVCRDLLVRAEIYQCHAGHLMCGSCRVRLLTCPVCRAPLTLPPIRNRAMERLAGLL